jgi:hypothetical protein
MFPWDLGLKTIALPRKVRHRGIFKVDWIFTLASERVRKQVVHNNFSAAC